MGRRLWAFGFVVMVLVGDLLFVAPMERQHLSLLTVIGIRPPDRPYHSAFGSVIETDGRLVVVTDDANLDDAARLATFQFKPGEYTAGLFTQVVEWHPDRVGLHVLESGVAAGHSRAEYRKAIVDVYRGLPGGRVDESVRMDGKTVWRVRPQWLLHDLVMLTAIVFLLWAGLRRAKLAWSAWRRKRRDWSKCAACGYSLTGLVEREDGMGPRCPECGRAGLETGSGRGAKG